jgi:hypothetical protein
MRDPYREWTPADRSEAWREGDYDGCRQYDSDFDSSDRAYDNWRNGGDFQDPQPNHRFS